MLIGLIVYTISESFAIFVVNTNTMYNKSSWKQTAETLNKKNYLLEWTCGRFSVTINTFLHL